VAGGLNIVLNEGRRRMESRDQVMALCGFSLHSNDITAGKLSVKSQFIPHNFNKAMASNCPLVAFAGSGKSCNKNQTCHPARKYGAQNESVLDQQSISGKIISLILCVWKLGYVKYGHIQSLLN